MTLQADASAVSASLSLLEEQISVVRRRVNGDTIRVSTVTNTTEQHVAEEISHERIEVEHIAIGRRIDTAPPTREEGGVTIIPIVEEVLVVEKRLFLKEEVHIRRVRVPATHRETITLRKQDVVVKRTKPEASQSATRSRPSYPSSLKE
jgi:uncharacterized protein (TIGR02271 family)